MKIQKTKKKKDIATEPIRLSNADRRKRKKSTINVIDLNDEAHKKAHNKKEVHVKKKDSLTSTIMFSIRRSKMNSESNIEGKRTSFLELFFDLAIVFVFSLVASGFAKAWHVDAETLLGNTHNEFVVSNIYVSVIYWIVSFMSLWMTWHQYNVYVRYYGRNNLSTHVLTFLLIIGVITQGMAKIVSFEFFMLYALIVSFVFNRFVLTLWMWLSIDRHSLAIAERYRYSVLKWQTGGLVFYILSALGLFLMVHFDVLTMDDQYDLTLVYTYVSAFVFIAFTYETTIELWQKDVKHEKVNMYESAMFHNKERHHLFLIITFGEMLVVNLATGTESIALYATLIPSLLINLIITMIIWYIYKTWVFAPEYKLNFKNRNLFTFLHIVIIFSITIILSSLETYSVGIHELEADKLGGGFNIGRLDLEHAIVTVYPLTFLMGYIVLIAAIMFLVLFADLHHSKFENAIVATKKLFLFSMLFPIFVSTVMVVIIFSGVEMNLLINEGVVLVSTAIAMAVALTGVNRHLLRNHDPKEVEDLLEEIHG